MGEAPARALPGEPGGIVFKEPPNCEVARLLLHFINE